MSRNSRMALKALTTAVASFVATGALASQGPGVPSGTASALTQTLMAVLVYGSAGLIIAWGAIRGVLRR